LLAGQLGDGTNQSDAQKKADQALAAIKSQVVVAEATILKNPEPVQSKGLRLLKAKRYEAGTDLLVPLARKPEASSELQLAVIKALLAMKKYETAAELLETYAGRLKEDPEPHYLRGLCYQNASIEKMQMMASIDPESYRLRWLMGDIYFEQERYDDAIKEYQAALNLQPGNSYLYLNLGNVCHRQMRYAEAAKYYERSVEADPQNAQAQLMLGESLLVERNVEQAMARLRTALDLDPSLLEAHVKLGKAFAMLDRFEEAVQELEQATAQDKDGSVHYQLGTYYRQLGKEEEANAALEKSKELKRQQLKRQELRTTSIEQKKGDQIDSRP
jgi:tetratricopeptide (TPR) repeat protein